MPLLYALRNDLQLNSPKFGCGLSQCGACTVIMDGNAIRSCVTPISAAQNKSVTTLDGPGTIKKMHKIQQAFVDEQAAQCGYCINGMIMSTKALLDKNTKPSDDQIKTALPATSVVAARIFAFFVRSSEHPANRLEGGNSWTSLAGNSQRRRSARILGPLARALCAHLWPGSRGYAAYCDAPSLGRARQQTVSSRPGKNYPAHRWRGRASRRRHDCHHSGENLTFLSL